MPARNEEDSKNDPEWTELQEGTPRPRKVDRYDTVRVLPDWTLKPLAHADRQELEVSPPIGGKIWHDYREENHARNKGWKGAVDSAERVYAALMGQSVNLQEQGNTEEGNRHFATGTETYEALTELQEYLHAHPEAGDDLESATHAPYAIECHASVPDTIEEGKTPIERGAFQIGLPEQYLDAR